MAWDSPERLHLMVEAMRLAFADARQYIADLATNPAPLDWLLSRLMPLSGGRWFRRIAPCNRRALAGRPPVRTRST